MTKKTKKILLNILTVIVFIIGLSIVYRDITNYNKPIYNYEIKREGNYQVLLKTNTFYTPSTLKKVTFYPSLGISNYLLEFNYNYLGLKNINLTYKYKIEGTLIGKKRNSNLNETVWIKEIPLVEQKEITTNKNKFTIKEKVTIDYNYYQELINAYEKEYKIELDATLKIKLIVEINLDLKNIKSSTKKIKNQDKIEDNIEASISLNNSLSHIEFNYDKETLKNISLRKDSVKTFYLGLLIIILTIISLIIRFKLKIKTPLKKYQLKLKNILKEYNELIVTVKKEPDLSNLKTMHLIYLNDLIDVAIQNNSNIILYEKIKNQKSNLYVIVNDYVYIYIITS